MPTYEYLCQNCGERLEVFQSFSAKPLKQHDACGGKLQKLFHASGVVFKGSGYYVTDSRSNGSGSKAADKKETNGSKDSKSNGSSTSDKKAKSTDKSDSKASAAD